MEYPVWYLPSIGGGLLIALIAVTHVFVSHFAVGGGLYLVLSERKALREKSDEIMSFTKTHARFFLLITMVYGSITGVGIWFIIALVSPAGTSVLIHNFVFGWATEWVFFLVEIVAAFVYYYLFDKMDSKTHQKVGWIYFISAWLSLFLINGIIDFMLTPGNWLKDHSFWAGFFNPSFFPALFFRTFVAVGLAGAYGYLTSSFNRKIEVKKKMTTYSAFWVLVAMLGAIPSGIWYISVLPKHAHSLVGGKSPTIVTAMHWGFWAVVLIAAFTILIGLIKPSLNHRVLAIIVFIAAFILVGAFEWTREAARRPFVINRVMYSNMIPVAEVKGLDEKGFLPRARWVLNHKVNSENETLAGEDLFRTQCYACHTIRGMNNSIVSRTKSMSFEALIKYIKRIHRVRYFMPPFIGNNTEIKALAAYIAGKLNGKNITLTPSKVSTGAQAGKAIFEDNCSACHEIGDLKKATSGWNLDKIRKTLDNLPAITPDMPPFEGTTKEKNSLASFLDSLKGGRK